MEHRAHKGTVELRAAPDGSPIIGGYAAVFNRDSLDLGFIEQIDPGAFTKTVREADVRGLGNHDVNWLLGRSKSNTLRLFVDSIGLGYEINVNPNDPDGVRAIEKVRRGDWDGSSFTFQTISDQWNWESSPPQRRLLEVALIDVGPVTFPAYPDATVAMRSALEPIAKRTGHEVEELVGAYKTGEIRSLLGREAGVKPKEQRALSIVWGPEDGFVDMLEDCVVQLPWNQVAVDVTLTQDKVLVYDCVEDAYWVAPITVDDTNEPTVSAPNVWVPVDSGWVASDEMNERTLNALAGAERRAGATLSAATKAQISAAMQTLQQLLDGTDAIENTDGDGDQEESNSMRFLVELRERELTVQQDSVRSLLVV